ncbi:hypothetical protein [Haladaptatus sp. CMAA 1911]|uniref:hypothetical protein n=1 Tax=unclassified Haladaptatus TaxID=2622732 RepID=UPI003754A41B
MSRYKVECVSLDYDSQYDDCRRVEEIGFRTESGGITTRTPRQVYEMINQDGDTVLVEYRGDLTEVIGVTHGTTKYVRTESTDTEDDALLKKPSC